MSKRTFMIALSILAAAMSPVRAAGADVLAGPVEARLLRVVDGDTLLVAAKPWPQQTIEVYVRLRGVDAAELRADCPAEREIARRAKEFLTSLMSGEDIALQLSQIEGDKYFGRILADVTLASGKNPATGLIETGLAVAYDGGRRRFGACPS